MAIVGFSFDKIAAERKGAATGKINIKNNVGIKDLQKADLTLGKAKQEGLKFIFEFVSKYEPKIGQISIGGEVLDIQEPAKVKEILAEWKKNKKVDQKIAQPIINMVLSKCNIEALILSRDLNLPPPIPLPKVGQQKK